MMRDMFTCMGYPHGQSCERCPRMALVARPGVKP